MNIEQKYKHDESVTIIPSGSAVGAHAHKLASVSTGLRRLPHNAKADNIQSSHHNMRQWYGLIPLKLLCDHPIREPTGAIVASHSFKVPFSH
jgi:hypothetical protein